MKAEITPQSSQRDAIATIQDAVGEKLFEILGASTPKDLTDISLRHVEPVIDDQRDVFDTSPKAKTRMPLLLASDPANKHLLEGITVTLEKDDRTRGDVLRIKNSSGNELTTVQMINEWPTEMRIKYPDSFSFGDNFGYMSRLSPDGRPPEEIQYLGLWVDKEDKYVYSDVYIIRLPFHQVQLAMPAGDKGWLIAAPQVESKTLESEPVNGEPKREIDFTEPEALAAIQKWQQSPRDFFADFWKKLGGHKRIEPDYAMSGPPQESQRGEPHITLAISGLTASVTIDRTVTNKRQEIHRPGYVSSNDSLHPDNHPDRPLTTDMIMLTIKYLDYPALQSRKVRAAENPKNARDLVMYWTQLDSGEIDIKNTVEWRDEDGKPRFLRDEVSSEQMAAITSFVTLEPVVVSEQAHQRPKSRQPEEPQRRRRGWG